MIYRNETSKKRAMSAKKEDSNILGNERREASEREKGESMRFLLFSMLALMDTSR